MRYGSQASADAHRSTADFPPAGHRLSALEPAWLRHLQQRVLVAYEVFAIGQRGDAVREDEKYWASK